MIRSSALLTVAAMAMLVAGVFSASLALIYASIAVSILAALTLGAGVLLRRRELFGAAAGDTRPAWAAADAVPARSAGTQQDGLRAAATGPASAVRPSGAGQAADDRARTGRGGRGGDGEQDGDLAEGPRQAASGAGPVRWPGSIAAKGAPVAGRRGGEHSAAHTAGRAGAGRPATETGPAARDPAARAPAPREPGREDRGRTERDRGLRAPGDREPAGRPWDDREPVRDEPAARDRTDRKRAGREPAGRDPRGRDAGREQPGSGREREPAVWGPRDQVARQDQEAAAPQAEAFRLPSADERAARARDAAARRERAGSAAAGDDFWDRVSEEISGTGSRGPVRPAWPSTAGPRAMGAGSAAKHGPAETGADEPEAAWSPPGYRQAEPASRGGKTARPATGADEDDGQAEPPAAGEARRERMVPPYVDDLSSSAGEEASQEAGGVWSAWSSIRATRAEEAASSGHDLPGPGGQRDEDEQRPEHAGAAGRDLPGRIVPDAGPSAGEPAESRATAGDVASGGAEASDNASEDEIAAADVAGDDRDGSGAAEPAAAADATQDGACVDGTADAGGTDETADRRAEAHEPGPGTAGPVTAEAKGERGEAGATEGALETERAGRPDHASASNRTEDNAGEDADHGAGHDGTPLDDEVTIVPGVARYHRRSCILIRFLGDGDLETTTRGDAEATGLVPCKACQPDKPGPSA